MRPSWSALAVASLLAGSVLAAPVARSHSPEDRQLPEKYRRAPYSVMSLSVGWPNRGYQLRAKRLKPSRELRVKPSSADNAYGHPALVLMLQRSAHELARAVRGSVMNVGDLSAERGGPLVGHRSHQSGRDADVGFYVLDPRGKPVLLDHFVAFDGAGKAVDGSGMTFDEQRNFLLVQSWTRDARAGLSHVFVATWLRKRLLEVAAERKISAALLTQMATLLKQPDSTSAHDDHFHVRIACPKKQEELCHEESLSD